MYEIIKKTLKLGLEVIIGMRMHAVNILMRNTVGAKEEIEKKYDISKGPYRHIKIITQ